MVIELVAEDRADLGKEKCKKLREQNKLPGNIYGGKLAEPKAISFDLHETEKLIKANGKGAEYAVKLGGETYPVRIQDVEVEPIYKGFLHLDLVVKNDG